MHTISPPALSNELSCQSREHASPFPESPVLHVSDVVFQILPGQSSGCTTRADSLRFTGNGNPAVLHLDMYLNTLKHPLGGETKKKKRQQHCFNHQVLG